MINIKNKNTIYYIAAIIIFFLLKIFYSLTEITNLKFLLNPTNRIIELVTNSDSHFIATHGYFHEDLNILIDKSCSGFNFCIICFALIIYLFINFLKSRKQKIIAFPLSLILAYIFTIFANASRIIISIMAQGTADNYIGVRPHLNLHHLTGSFIYLFFLIIIYSGIHLLLIKIKHNEKFVKA